MKRQSEAVAAETARVHARPCPVPPEALLALLDNADDTVCQLLAGLVAVASLVANMGTRKAASVLVSRSDVAAARAALVRTTKRAAYCARRRARSNFKSADAVTEVLRVTAKQLRVWASPAMTLLCAVQAIEDVIGGGCALASLRPLLRVESTALEWNHVVQRALDICNASSVVAGDGLRVVSAAGPGLKWFEPNSRNEFSVVLAHADGSVPVWLMTGDVVVAAVSTCSAAGNGRPTVTAVAVAATVRLDYHGIVNVTCEDFSGMNSGEDCEMHVQLVVCGVFAGDTAGDGDWGLVVLRRSLTNHVCAAAGTHIRSLSVVEGGKCGVAVSADEQWLVVGLVHEGTLSVYALPGGERVRTFGGRGEGPLLFEGLHRLCFAPNGNLVVVDGHYKRLHEVTLQGMFVRYVGEGEFGDGRPFCVDVHDDVIAVGCLGGTGRRVVQFGFGSGAVTSRFGEVGTALGQLNVSCTGIRFAADGSQLVVAEGYAQRLSLFTAAGVFVRALGVGWLAEGVMDVVQSVTGEYVVADYRNHRVCVFSRDGVTLVRSWGVYGTVPGLFQFPTGLAVARHHVYVMDNRMSRVQVFE